MSALAVVSLVLAAGWGVAAAVAVRRDRRRALAAALVGVAQVLALWVPLLAVPGWLAYAGLLGRRARSGRADDRRMLEWVVAGGSLAAGVVVLAAALHVMTDVPRHLPPWAVGALLLVPVADVAASLVPSRAMAARAVRLAVTATGLAALVALVYLVVVVGIGGVPHGHERSVLLSSVAAAVIVALLVVPARDRLLSYADVLAGRRNALPEEAAGSFAARMSRAIPMDELLLQLAESLRSATAGAVAEVWTGTDGALVRAVRVPSGPPARMELRSEETAVVGRARLGGPAWIAVWLPQLLTEAEAGGDVRVAPVAHLGELLGLLVLRRPAEAGPFTEEDEGPLVEVARQLGLALHNVRLDSALQASLAELAERNEELQASRLRIVQASDESRRQIERNLHDGAQQHLVALAVKLGLMRSLVEELADAGADPTSTGLLLTSLDDLRGDVQTTVGELRELAHGIYPPLLRDRGLAEALRTAGDRSPLSCVITVQLPGRYPEAVETATYFCCLEAMQNAAKHAGTQAELSVNVTAVDDQLRFCVRDDGAGFDPGATPGHGFENMRDRLGALGGALTVTSRPGAGTTIEGGIPAVPREAVAPSSSGSG